MIKQPKWLIVLVFSSFVFLSLACLGFSQGQSVETDLPLPNDDPGAVETQVYAAIATAASGGRIVLEFTEGQLTATANQELQSSGEQSIRDLRVALDDGLVTITGKVNQSGFDLPLTIDLTISVDGSGVPHTNVVGGKLGPFSLPQDMLDQIAAQFDQVLQDELDASAENLFVESVSIDNGKITIVAENR